MTSALTNRRMNPKYRKLPPRVMSCFSIATEGWPQCCLSFLEMLLIFPEKCTDHCWQSFFYKWYKEVSLLSFFWNVSFIVTRTLVKLCLTLFTMKNGIPKLKIKNKENSKTTLASIIKSFRHFLLIFKSWMFMIILTLNFKNIILFMLVIAFQNSYL